MAFTSEKENPCDRWSVGKSGKRPRNQGSPPKLVVIVEIVMVVILEEYKQEARGSRMSSLWPLPASELISAPIAPRATRREQTSQESVVTFCLSWRQSARQLRMPSCAPPVIVPIYQQCAFTPIHLAPSRVSSAESRSHFKEERQIERANCGHLLVDLPRLPLQPASSDGQSLQ